MTMNRLQLPPAHRPRFATPKAELNFAVLFAHCAKLLNLRTQ